MRFKYPPNQPKRFHEPSRYLAGRTSKSRDDKVLWVEERELGTTDPHEAARLMEATAEQSVRVKNAPMHFIISFDPKDAAKGHVDPEMMKEVATDVIKRLGLTEHQMLIAAHKDRDHPHIHFLVNRVHPETGRAWSHRNIGKKLTVICRDIAQERGLNVLKEKDRERDKDRVSKKTREHESTKERDVDWSRVEDIAEPVADGEYRTAKKEDREPERKFNRDATAKLRSELSDDFRDAKSWKDLSGRLAERGLVLRTKGQGLIVSDGTLYAKLSDMGKTVRQTGLEERFGERFVAFRARQAKELARAELEREREENLPEGLSEEAQRNERRRRQRDADEQRSRDDAIDPLQALEHADFSYRVWSSIERTVVTGERIVKQAERNLERQDKWERFWQGRTKEQEAGFFESLARHVRDTGQAHHKWQALEKAYGVDQAARMVLADPSLVGGRRSGFSGAARAERSNKEVERSWKELVRHRRKWGDAKLRLADSRDKAENARFALQRARSDYRHLLDQMGSREEVRKYLRRSIQLRARELDRVGRQAFRKSRIAEQRMDQLKRAWRLHEGRRRRRDREREEERQQGREY